MYVDMRYENKVKGGKRRKSRDASSISNQISKPNSLRDVKDVPEKKAHKCSSRKIHIPTDVKEAVCQENEYVVKPAINIAV